MQLHSLLLAIAAFAIASPLPDAPAPDSHYTSLTSKIKNVVVLIEENRSFDSFAGGLSYASDIDGLLHTKYCNPANVSFPSQNIICAQNTAQNIAPDDPPHGISGGNMQIFGTYHPTGSSAPTMQGYITEQESAFKTNNVTRAAEAINYYAPEHVRVFEAMAKDFVLFDRWFCAVPGPTNPNRAYITAGTSHGHGK
jgi:phospholipase C